MARKKPDSGGGGGNAPWLNTFADLMNLLLCFFVLLFAMSDVNAEKFENISISMANSIGILDGGGASFGNGNLISAGMSQMNELDEYYTNMGRASKETGKDADAKANNSKQSQTDMSNENGQTNDGVMGNEGSDGIKNIKGDISTEGNNDGQGSTGTQNKEGSGTAELADALERIEQEQAEVSSGMYDDISDLTEKYNLGDYVEISIDPEYQYVQLTMKGSILFDSGDAELKKASLPVLSNIGEILKKFDGYKIEITGYTDNVPMGSGKYKDNNWLSSARALNAAEYLIKNSGLNPADVKYSGRGEYEPIASNSTAEGRAKNRRIEVKIYNEYSVK